MQIQGIIDMRNGKSEEDTAKQANALIDHILKCEKAISELKEEIKKNRKSLNDLKAPRVSLGEVLGMDGVSPLRATLSE